MVEKKRFDIYDRAFQFAVRTAKLVNRLPGGMATREYSRQLIRSSGSVGSNLEEADGALTRKDFVNKVGISRREAKESWHWLRLIMATTDLMKKNDQEEIEWRLMKAKKFC